jgi:hypothetical protein
MALGLSALLPSSAARAEISLLAEDAGGVTLLFEPGPMSLEKSGDPEGGVRPVFADADELLGEPGGPWLPMRGILVALPRGAGATVRVVERDVEELPRVDLAPIPGAAPFADREANRAAGAAVIWPRDPDAYRAAGALPWVVAGRAASQRGVSVLPLRFLAARPTMSGGLDAVRRLVVRIDYQGGSGGAGSTQPVGASPTARSWEQLRESAFINWRSVSAQATVPPGPLRAGAAGESVAIDQSENWLRVEVDQSAIYAVGAADFAAAGVHTDAVDPASVRVFCAAPTPLPESLTDSPRVFVEIPRLLEDDGDARLEGDERVLFFAAALRAEEDGTGAVDRPHPYDDRNVYWITWGWGMPGEPMEAVARNAAPLGTEPRRDWVRRVVHREPELITVFSWGSAWYWDLQAGQGEATHSYELELPRAVDAAPARVRAREIGTVTTSAVFNEHHVRVALNDPANVVGESEWDGLVERTIEGEPATAPEAGGNSVLVTVLRDRDVSGFNDQLLLDWIEIDYAALADAGGGRDQWDFFVERDSTELPWVTTIGGLSGGAPRVWDVTDPLAPQLLDGRAVGNFVELRFADSGRRRYQAASTPRTPLAVDRYQPKHLRSANHGADWIAVTDAEMAPEAERLAAHRRARGLRTAVVDIDDVYAEFSCGVQDPTALRDFLRAAYLGWQAPAPSYVLLFGDGTYDSKNNAGWAEHRQVVPTHQSRAVRYASNVDALDGWFATVDGDDSVQDMMLGRFAIRGRDSAREVVDKLIRYEKGEQDPGRWRMRAVLVADDERNPDFAYSGESIHTLDSERLAEQALPSWLEVNRLYLVDYVLEGQEKPRARDAIVAAFNEGALVVNYLGHGNQIQWAHENVFRSNRDIPLLHNEGTWPLVLAGSCTVGRFDLDNEDCMAEDLTEYYDRGAVAMVAATRPTYSNPNFRMIRTLMRNLFVEGDHTAGLDIGAAHLSARLAEGNGRNEKLNHLFGDPATPIAVPRYQVVVDAAPDSLGPLDVAQIEGHIEDAAGNLVAAEGSLDLVVRDGAFDEIFTVPSSGLRIPFLRRGESLFAGSVVVTSGRFQAGFVAPRGFRAGERGQIAAYAELTGEAVDASGIARDLHFRADPASIDAVEALHPIDEAAGIYVERNWGWADAGVQNRESALGSPDGNAANIDPGAWIGLDFAATAQSELITDGVEDGSGPDLQIHATRDASVAVFASSNAVNWQFMGVARESASVEMGSGLRKARYVRLYPTATDTLGVDSEPPEIHAFAAGREIGPSGVTLSRGNPVSFLLQDEQGIALLPGVDRGITLRVETLSESGLVIGRDDFDLGASFHYDRGSYERGRVAHSLDQPPGRYRLTLSASDNTGARTSAEVEVSVGAGLSLRDLRAYPNPFAKRTWITWHGSTDAGARVKIYTVTGRLIQVLEDEPDPALEGYRFVEWDGRDADGDQVANGVYLFRVELSSSIPGEKVDGLGRVVVMR